MTDYTIDCPSVITFWGLTIQVAYLCFEQSSEFSIWLGFFGFFFKYEVINHHLSAFVLC